jgi:hypothetical protein
MAIRTEKSNMKSGIFTLYIFSVLAIETLQNHFILEFLKLAFWRSFASLKNAVLESVVG